MTQLQTIVNGQTATMTSREIADIADARHNDVMATINRLFDKGLLRSSRKTRQEATGGRPTEVYDLVERDVYLVIAGYSDEVRARIVDRWQELEAQAHAFNPASLSRMDLIKIAMEAESERLALADKVQAQQAQIAAAAPAVEFVGKYVRATGLMGFREVCKLLKANEARFREFLIVRQIMYRLGGVLTAYQHHTDAGRFEVRTGVADGTEHAYTSTKFTPKGIDWVAGEWAKYQLHNEQAHGAALAMN